MLLLYTVAVMAQLSEGGRGGEGAGVGGCAMGAQQRVPALPAPAQAQARWLSPHHRCWPCPACLPLPLVPACGARHPPTAPSRSPQKPDAVECSEQGRDHGGRALRGGDGQSCLIIRTGAAVRAAPPHSGAQGGQACAQVRDCCPPAARAHRACTAPSLALVPSPSTHHRHRQRNGGQRADGAHRVAVPADVDAAGGGGVRRGGRGRHAARRRRCWQKAPPRTHLLSVIRQRPPAHAEGGQAVVRRLVGGERMASEEARCDLLPTAPGAPEMVPRYSPVASL